MKRIAAHDDRAVGKVAEHASGVFSGDAGLSAAAYWMTEYGIVKGVWNALLDRDLQYDRLPVILLDDAA